MSDSISCYIHIPFCKSKCIYCDFFSKTNCEQYFDDYVNALINEIKFYSRKFNYKKLNTFYIGGGTPSLLSVFALDKILCTLKESFEFAEDYEGTIELNPDDVTEELIEYLNKSCINRISVGIQSFSSDVLNLMQRRATKETSLKALELIQKKYKKRFSADLIVGFPCQTNDILKNDIDILCRFNPEHISLYSLCVEEGTKLKCLISENKIKFDQDVSDEQWIFAKDYLIKKGYNRYEISNYSKEQKSQSRHNLVYWHLKNYFGFGSGATGTIFKNHQGKRYSNTLDLKKYIDFWLNKNICKNKFNDDFEKKMQEENFPLQEEFIDFKTEEFEFFMMNFRLTCGVSKNEYETRFGKSLQERLKQSEGVFFEWCKKGLAKIQYEENDEYYKLTEEGLLYLNLFLEQI